MEKVVKRDPRRKVSSPLVVGSGKNMQFNPHVWEKWNSDACDKDMWKHGRISDAYRKRYDLIKWNGKGVAPCK